MSPSEKQITDEEAALYDRQIRLWGLESQRKLSQARILMCGMTGAAVEIIKNLVLAGVAAVTLLDHRQVSQGHDSGYNFFLQHAEGSDCGKLRVEAMLGQVKDMNPRVKVQVDTRNLADLMDQQQDQQDDFFKEFDVVCISDYSFNVTGNVDSACRRLGVKFYAVSQYGWYAWAFADMGPQFSFTVEKRKTAGSEEKETSACRSDWVSFDDALIKGWFNDECQKMSLRQVKRHVSPVFFVVAFLYDFEQRTGSCWKKAKKDKLVQEYHEYLTDTLKLDESLCDATVLQQVYDNMNSNLCPVAAIVGGIVAQDMIRCISRKEQPIRNFMFVDSLAFSAQLQFVRP